VSTAMQQESQKRQGSLLRTVQAVAWSFLGLRRSKDFQEDVAKLSPIHIIVVGLLGAALFVGGLILLVNWVAG
jgi:hypothetical protein